ncbi:unnamed protein product [Orchesella dallaii]|uniref:Odorant receptor n=1 Tax=Orchesella dallaii TaxID=48710 RepID=A0ABP1S6R5_9HEXA
MLRLYIYNFRVAEIMTLTICKPFGWNYQRNRMEATKGIEFFLYRVVSTSICCIAFFISFRLVKALWFESVDVIGVLIAIIYASLLTTSGGLMWEICRKQGEFSAFINGVLGFDKILKRVFPEAYIHAMETQQHKFSRYNHLILFSLIASITCNWGLMFFFFEKWDPVHRGLVEYLGLHPEWNLMFIPIGVAEAWYGYIIGHTVSIFIFGLVLYLTTELWLTSLAYGMDRYDGRRSGIDKHMMGRAHLRFYRCHQVLANICYGITASVLITVHHVCLLIFHIVATYLVLTPEIGVTTTVSVLTACGIPVAYVITYNEVVFLARFGEASANFLGKCRLHYGTSRYLRRGFKSCRPIHIESGYPFFCIKHKKWFAIYAKIIVEMVINLKLSLRKMY